MATFNLKKYLTGDFQTGDTAEEIKTAANEIIANEKNVRRAFGNNSPIGWAKTALIKLEKYETHKAGKSGPVHGGKAESSADAAKRTLLEASKWITGAKQPSTAKRLQGRQQERAQKLKKDIANAASNYANVMDISPTASETERANAETKGAERKAELDELIARGESMGVDVAKAQELTRTPSGFIPTGEISPAPAGGKGALGRMGEPIVARQETDGTYSIIGSTSGKILESGLADASAANRKMTELQSGAVPDAIGAFAGRVGSAAGETPKSSVLDSAGVNYTGLGADQVKQVEASFLASQNDPTLQEKIINNLDITDEDIKGFLETAKSEYSPYYQQQFGRGAEDFTKSLEFAAVQRQDQMTQEALQKQLALEQEQVGMAEAGLATSGIRKKAEERLAEQARNIATSSRRAFEYDVTKAGRSAEDILGSATVAGLQLPTLGGTSVYTPAGDIRGSMERERTTAEQTRAAELEELARTRRTEILGMQGNVTTL